MNGFNRHQHLGLILLAVLGTCMVWGATPVLANDTVNLFQTERAKIERCSDPWLTLEELKVLTDGNSLNARTLSLQHDIPTDLVYSFENTIVSPRQLIVQLNYSSDTTTIVGQFELLGSMISSQAGFQLLREDSLRATKVPQEFAFPSTGVKWIMLRLKVPKGTGRLPVSEITLQGKEGPPRSNYAFKQSPVSALQVIQGLKTVTQLRPRSTDELDMLEDARDGKLDRWSLADAALLAQGIAARSSRDAYKAKLTALERAASQALAGVTDPMQRGEKLLAWLHATVLRDYQPEQMYLTVLLDTYAFNCVSATVLYTLLGERLGLDVRTIETPDHVFSILYHQLTHADVENTSSNGFNPARDSEVLRQFFNTTGFTYIEETHKDQRREITNVGLLGIVYCARGAELARKHLCPEALQEFFCALTLDSEIYSAIHNVLSTLSGWSILLAMEGKFPEAIQVAQAGLGLAPKDENLIFTHKIICLQWAEYKLSQNDSPGALAIFIQAAKASPGAGFESLQALTFIRGGTALAEKGEWEKALALAATGMRTVTPEAQKELLTWQSSLYFAWCLSELDKLNYESAVRVLEAALRALPDEKQFPYYLGFITQTWAEDAWEKNDVRTAVRILGAMLKRHPNVREVKWAALRFTGRIAERSLESIFKLEILLPLETFPFLLGNEGQLLSRIRLFYIQLAMRHLRHQEWKLALDIYHRALKLFPADAKLREQALGLWNNWVYTYIQAGEWEKALSIAERAARQNLDNGYFQELCSDIIAEYSEVLMKQKGQEKTEAWLGRMVNRFPENPFVPEAIETYRQHRMDELEKDPQKNAKAEALKKRCDALLPDDGVPQKLTIEQYDAISIKHAQVGHWERAIRVYKNALRFYPNDGHVRKNALALWDTWYKSILQSGNYDETLRVCDRAAQQSPDAKHFENNFAFVVQEYVRSAYAQGGITQSSALVGDLLKKYPFKPCIREKALDHFASLLETSNAQDLPQYELFARLVMQKADALLNDPMVNDELTHIMYTRMAREATQRGDKKSALQYQSAAVKFAPRTTLNQQQVLPVMEPQ